MYTIIKLYIISEKKVYYGVYGETFADLKIQNEMITNGIGEMLHERCRRTDRFIDRCN